MQWFGDLSTAGIGTDRDGDGQSDAAEYAARERAVEWRVAEETSAGYLEFRRSRAA